MIKQVIRSEIIDSLKAQGFSISNNKLFIENDNGVIRKAQLKAREEKIKQHLKFLISQNGSIKNYILNGKELQPKNIELELRVVKPNTIEEVIFKWWNLVWWSIPYDRAYGRQMRFILWDKYHDKPFGLIGLQSAPLRMKIRDDYLGINKEDRDWWVNFSMSAQRVGALPPYNQIIGGKMVAMGLASKEIRETYIQKYNNYETIIKKRKLPAELLFITTTGAFGKSSIYNRVKYYNDKLIEFLGYTKGSGAFHIPESIYQKILQLLESEGINTDRGYGHGPSRKRQLLHQGFQLLNLRDFEYHGVKRAFYLISHIYNLKQVIQKKHVPIYKKYTISQLCDFWKDRWAIKRSERFNDWKKFDANNFWDMTQRQLKMLAKYTKG